MKIFFTLFILTSLFTRLHAQGGAWVWVKGSDTANSPGVFGVQGIPDTNNTPGGFYEAACWKDLDGNFWIFGGLNYRQFETSDLWKYDPQANIWIWIKGPGVEFDPGTYGIQGVPSLANNPPHYGYGAHTWTDKTGDLWLFGGDEVGNTLWRYHIETNEWTWMKGSDSSWTDEFPVYGTLRVASESATPGTRLEGTDDWVDKSGDLWFFGSMGLEQANGVAYTVEYNDMWKYSIATNNWCWMSGPGNADTPANFGIKGVENASNLPPQLNTYCRWQDEAGNFYIFGGYAAYHHGIYRLDVYNTVWRYNTSNNYWTWIAGDSTVNAGGLYGSYCTDNNLEPPARCENRSPQTTDCNQQFVSFGGYDSAGAKNDLWAFNINNFQWRWLSGSDTDNSPGQYGMMGLPAPNNVPSACAGACIWQGNDGNLWIFGGVGYAPNLEHYNDVWKFVPDPACLSTPGNSSIICQLNKNNICEGDSAYLNIKNVSNIHIYPMGRASMADSASAWLFPDTTTIFTVTGTTLCGTIDTATITLPVISSAHTISIPDAAVCAGTASTISVIGFSNISIMPSAAVVWADSSHIRITPDTTTTFTMQGSNCKGLFDTTFTISVIRDSLLVTAPKTSACKGDTIRLCTATGYTSYGWNNGDTGHCIACVAPGNYYVSATDNDNCSAFSNRVSLTFYDAPPVTITTSGDTLKGYNAIAYQWYLNDTLISDADSSFYIVKMPGSYTLQINDSNGCTALSNALVITGLSELSGNSISIYPNPTSNSWHVSVDGRLVGSTVQVFDATGKLLYQSTLNKQQSEIELPGAASGVYGLRIISSGFSFTRKVVKF